MKYLLLALIALGLNGCIPDIGDTDNSTTTITEEYGDDTIVINCSGADGTDCEVNYPGEDFTRDTNSSLPGAIPPDGYGSCPAGYFYCSIEGTCLPTTTTVEGSCPVHLDDN